MDGAILVVSAKDGLMPETSKQIDLARMLDLPALVVYMNKVDLVDDPEHLDKVEMEIVELLTSSDFPGDDVPLIHGSALKALENIDDDIGKNSISKLVEKLDSHIPQPECEIDQPFLMPINDVHEITGRGTLVTGRIDQGILEANNVLEIVGLHDTQNTTMFESLLIRVVLVTMLVCCYATSPCMLSVDKL